MITDAAITRYAQRHGMTFYEAARAMGRKGGAARAAKRRREQEQADYDRRQREAFERMRRQMPDY